MKTFMAKPSNIENRWWLVDADGRLQNHRRGRKPGGSLWSGAQALVPLEIEPLQLRKRSAKHRHTPEGSQP